MSLASRFNRDVAVGLERQAKQVSPLAALWADTLATAGQNAQTRFALTAAVDWQPPPDGSLLTPAQVAALAAALNSQLRPVWAQVVLDVVKKPLARIEIAWDVKHPLVAGQLDAAAQRTGARLDSAVQFILRGTIAAAYDGGLDVRETAALIKARITEATPWQAEMLARTDLVGLSNGASRAAAAEVGMQYKTWDATLDAVTRPTHAEAHGQVVPINDTFEVGGEEALYPGDPNLSDAEAANCRCTLVYGETLAEANALLAAGLPNETGGSIMAGVTTRQRKRRQERRAAKGRSAPALTAAARPVGFSGIAAIEGRISDDNSIAPRVLLPNSLAWPEMPLSFMAQTKTAEGHDGAETAGRIDEFKRKRSTGRMQNIHFSGELTTPFGIDEIAPMIDDQTMRYVSVDLGASEWALIDRKTFDVVAEEEFDLAKAQDGGYALGLVSGKIKATTLVPTQAIEGALVALTASADACGLGYEDLGDGDARLVLPLEGLTLGEVSEVALIAAAAPMDPPIAWFETAEPPGKMPLTITKDGRVYGHLATWDSCHASFLPQCVPPPRSPSNYARFHTSYLDTAEGDEISVGKLMFSPNDGGHADRRLTAAKASAYYDRTGMAAAYLRATDGEFGIWVAGALNPKLTDAQRKEMRRECRLNPPSGDWRIWDGQHDLLCGLAVAIPGFGVNAAVRVSVVASAEGVEVQGALIASSGWFEPDPAAVAALEAVGLADEDLLAEAQMRALAARADGLGSLAASVS